jgi:DNA recombination protein RmuC
VTTAFFVVLAVLVVLVGVVAAFVVPPRVAGAARDAIGERLSSVERGQERIERAVREEIAHSRTEASQHAAQLRDELRATLKETGDSVDQRLDRFAAQLVDLSRAVASRLDQFQKATDERLHNSHLEQVAKLDQTMKVLGDSASDLRNELTQTLKGFGDSLDKRSADSNTSQLKQLGAFDARLEKLTDSNEKKLQEMRTELATTAAAQRAEVATSLKNLATTISEQLTSMAAVQKAAMETFSGTLHRLTEGNEKRLNELRATVDTKLQSLQDDNAKRLESMRQTVDEKLQGTLEKRLGESFKFVGDRLEAVQAGLGEMRTLASGVGDLKKVLSNVKVRGTWGEIQLGGLLAQVLAPEQYAANVSTKPHSSERVEFAIRFPGGDDGEEVLVPIDSKFPMEDYQRLVEASERGDPAGVEDCSRQLEHRIKLCAQDISSKYLNPPHTTDFGILFLPTEGLYAEVVRRNGLIESLQREFRVAVAGPTTLAAFLNSLQMGFKTLAIQKRSSEVWQILAAVKSEFGKFGEVIDSVDKKLAEASKKLGTVGTRSRAIERQLRDVQELPAADAQAILLTGAPGAGEMVEIDEPEPVS